MSPAALKLLLLMAVAAASTAFTQPGRIAPGSPFPALKLKALMPPGRPVDAPQALDLGASIGRRPIVICYLVLGEPMSEEMLAQVQGLAEGPMKGKVDVYGAIKLGRRTGLKEAAERMKLLGLTIPLIVEEEFNLGSMLGAFTSPSISLIDAKGVLRINDAKSLRQEVSGAMKMSDAIKAAVSGGAVPTVNRLARYYPAAEMVGAKYPDFILKEFESSESLKLSSRVIKDGKRITVLFFWHPNCKPCEKAMPGILEGARAMKNYIQVFSVVNLTSDDEIRNCGDAIKAHEIGFPVLTDEGKRVNELYKVVSTPTLFFIRPDGVVDSVYTSGDVNYLPVFNAKIQSILKPKPAAME